MSLTLSVLRRRFLFWCAHDHLDFRLPEFESLAKLCGLSPLQYVEAPKNEPWVILELKSEADALRLLSRSVSTKYCVELWGDSTSYDDLHAQLRAYPAELSEPFCKKELSFKIYVEAFMNKLSYEERLQRIESLSYLPVQGPVRMSNPDVTFSLFEFWGFDHNHLPESPLRLFFGRCIGHGCRELITKMSIKKRKFIGNTTMDPTLALLAANLVCVRPASLVLDPFVGTGSMLLSAAQFGGYVIGGDIDFLMLHARTRPSRKGQKVRALDESIRANFEQYGLEKQYLDVVVCDASSPPWRLIAGLGSILTDPPYGIREPTAKVGTDKDTVVIPEEYLQHHIPQKVEYGLSDIYKDLMTFSASALEVGGRVGFWIPINREEYSQAELPKHPNLNLVANCEQILSSHTSRRFIVMEKISSVSDFEESAEITAGSLLPESTATFREHFYSATEMGRRERKERIKKYGHLNTKEQKTEEHE